MYTTQCEREFLIQISQCIIEGWWNIEKKVSECQCSHILKVRIGH